MQMTYFPYLYSMQESHISGTDVASQNRPRENDTPWKFTVEQYKLVYKHQTIILALSTSKCLSFKGGKKGKNGPTATESLFGYCNHKALSSSVR